MNSIKIKLFTLALVVFFTACDVDYEANPNEIVNPPTSGVLNDATKKMVDELYNEWFAGRFTLVTMQYFTQTAYADEDRYVYRETQRETWYDFYRNLENWRKVIYLNTNEDTKDVNSQYGSNDNQIAVARILMSWAFNIMTDTWGDIPYYSYGSDNANFQALQVADAETEILYPAYAEQSEIYPDILKELQEAEAMIGVNEKGVVGDNIYNGDMAKWKKFANSLRLRIALKIQAVDATTADAHISDAISKGVFTSNADNAGFTYEEADVNAAPFYRAFNVTNRTDFAISHSFTELLLGNDIVNADGVSVTDNPFQGKVDPRIEVYAQENEFGDYVGMPVSENSADAGVFNWESWPGLLIVGKDQTDREAPPLKAAASFTQPLMEFAEVMFIMSELNGWSQEYYEDGIEASMENWGIEESEMTAYMTGLAPASEETVLTQKYIALYMEPHIAWAEYRRTGYPQTLLLPGMEYKVSVPEVRDFNYKFTSLVQGITDIPYRLQYPDFERTLNGVNRGKAVAELDNGDALNSKLWWDVN
jgi:hypothetical protein